MSDGETDGERKVRKLLEQLPSDEFSCYVEPRIDRKEETSRHPDFLIIWRQKGLLAVEVKDYFSLEYEGSNQNKINIIDATGKPVTKQNPYKTARNYAIAVCELFEKGGSF